VKRSLPNSSARLQPYVVECQRRRCATNQASLRATQQQELKMKVEQMKRRETALLLGLIGAKKNGDSEAMRPIPPSQSL
jgi:hypothetical protein